MNKPITNIRIIRLLFLLQKYGIIVVDRPRRENLVVDFLFRLHNEGEVVPVEDSFPYENLFVVSFKSPRFVDIANYISTGQLHTHL